MAESGSYDQATVQRRQAIAEAMLKDSRNAKPIRHWAEGLAQLADAGVAGYAFNKAEGEAKALKAQDAASLASLLGGGTPSPTSAPVAPVAAPETAPPTQPGTVVADAMTDKSLPRGFRNQNPGNIEDGPFARSQPGYAGSDGRFAKFASMDQGTGAMGSLLESYGKKGINTVGGIINRWAPASDGNNVSSYAQAVARAAGVDPTAPIDISNPEIKQKIVAAMAQHENGRPLPQSPVAQAMVPPTMPAAQPAAPGGLLAGATPQQRAAILQGMQAGEGSPARAIAMSMMTQLMKPQEFGFQNQPDGTILRTNPRTGTVEPVYQGATKPTFGDTGEVDPQTGQPVKGFIDPTKQTVTPYKPQPTATAQPSTIPPVPPGVDPKVWREAQSKRATEDGMPADTKVTSALRNEIQGLPSYKNLAQAAPVYRAMSEAAGRDNRAADLNLIYGFGKIMDPGSVVRESEMTMAEKINTLPQYLRATAESQLSGSGRLSPEVRAQILEEAHTRIQSYKGLFDQDSGMYRGIAKRGRMNEEDVIPNFGEFPSWTPPKASAPVEIDGYKIRAK